MYKGDVRALFLNGQLDYMHVGFYMCSLEDLVEVMHDVRIVYEVEQYLAINN